MFKPNNATKDILIEEYNQFYTDEEFEAILNYIYEKKHDHLIYRPFNN